ncbi:MAG TPA: adenylate cyclase regulatory domain-containing protein [Actinomycetota bacterium]|nr:adenylate cyclase regulatory domain-containing protein [Actinomycetota bacterium]
MPAPSGDRIGEDELLERTGFERDHVRRLAELDILERDEAGTYPRREIVRARVVADLEALGVTPEDIAHALATGHLSLAYLETSGRRFPSSELSFAEVAGELGIPFESLERMYVAYGLARPSPDEPVREEDLKELHKLPVLLDAGVSVDDVLRTARVWGDAARRVAQFLTHQFHVAIEEPFRRQGLGDNQAYEAAIKTVGLRMGRSGEDLLTWLFRRHLETFLREHQFEHAEVALEAAGVHERSAKRPGAAAFADLTGYTRLTEEAGDEVAAQVSLSLADLVSEVASRHRGTVVKMLGDGVHFHFADPRDAVLAALAVVDAVGPRGLPPAHIGIEAGPMIYDEGDYFGRTVNVAARIASEAGAGQVFVGEGLAEMVEPDGFGLSEVGAFELKGLARAMRLYEVRREARP